MKSVQETGLQIQTENSYEEKEEYTAITFYILYTEADGCQILKVIVR